MHVLYTGHLFIAQQSHVQDLPCQLEGKPITFITSTLKPFLDWMKYFQEWPPELLNANHQIQHIINHESLEGHLWATSKQQPFGSPVLDPPLGLGGDGDFIFK